MQLHVPPITDRVVPELRAFVATLSHLPVGEQVAVLQQATDQIASWLSSKTERG